MNDKNEMLPDIAPNPGVGLHKRRTIVGYPPPPDKLCDCSDGWETD